MCLITFAWRAHPRYEFIMAANRDEFHHRVAAPAHFWTDAPQVLAGRDLEQNGTWCGITRSGRHAAVTNFRDPSTRATDQRSRGLLVSEYLRGRQDAGEYAAAAWRDKDRYAGFNLLVGDRQSLHYVGSHGDGWRRIAPGVHGLSNGVLDSAWPKVRRAQASLSGLIATDRVAPASLFELLASREPAADPELPDTGVGLELERFLSPVFIQSAAYGTRCSTVLLVDSDGEVTFAERSFDSQGNATGAVEERFRISAP